VTLGRLMPCEAWGEEWQRMVGLHIILLFITVSAYSQYVEFTCFLSVDKHAADVMLFLFSLLFIV